MRNENLNLQESTERFWRGEKVVGVFVCFLDKITFFHSYNLILLEWSGNSPEAVVSLLQYENPVYCYSSLHLLCYKRLVCSFGDVLQKLRHAVLETDFHDLTCQEIRLWPLILSRISQSVQYPEVAFVLVETNEVFDIFFFFFFLVCHSTLIYTTLYLGMRV